MESERERKIAKEAAQSLQQGLRHIDNDDYSYFENFVEKLADLIAFRIDSHQHPESKLDKIVNLIRERGRLRTDRAADFLVEQGFFTSDYKARSAIQLLVKTHKLRVVEGLYLEAATLQQKKQESGGKYHTTQKHLF